MFVLSGFSYFNINKVQHFTKTRVFVFVSARTDCQISLKLEL